MDERQRFVKALANSRSYSIPSSSVAIPTPQQNGGFFTNLARSIPSLGATATRGVASVPGKIASDIVRGAQVTVENFYEILTQNKRDELRGINKSNDDLSSRAQEAVRRYKSGELSKDEYIEARLNISEQAQALSKSSQAIQAWADPRERAIRTADTLLLPLAFTKLKYVSAANRARTPTSVIRATAALEDAATKNPVLRNILAKNSVTFNRTGQEAFKHGSKELAMGYFIKYPLFIGQNVRETKELLQDVVDSNMKGAAWHAALLGLEAFQGGPFGAAIRFTKGVGKQAKVLTFNQQGMYDLISAASKWDEDIGSYLTRIKTSDPKLYQEYETALRGLQASNLERFDGNHYDSASHLIEWFAKARNVDLSQQSAEWFVKDMSKFYKNWDSVITQVKAGKIKGIDPSDWDKISLGVMDQATKSSLIRELKEVNKLGGLNGMSQYLQDLQAQGIQWTQNQKMFGMVVETLQHDDWARRIKKIETSRLLDEVKIPAALKKKLAEEGYFLNRPQKVDAPFFEGSEAPKIVSKFAKDNADLTWPTRALPGLGFVGSTLQRFGLSPEQTGGFVQTTIKSNFARHLADSDELSGLVGDSVSDARVIINRLQQYADDIRPGSIVQRLTYGEKFSPVYDLRLLDESEIMKALDVSSKQAKAVKNALMQSYLDVPVMFRGLGERLQDLNLQKNPFAPIYSRIQSTFRYTYNPFFRTQEISETRVIAFSRYPGINTIRGIFGIGKAEIRKNVELLEKKGVFSDQFSGEAAADQLLGKLTANITNPQKEALAGVVATIAKKRGMDVETLLERNGDEVVDAIRIIVQYPKKSVLNSAFARTLNVAFFPARYNLKVAQLAAESISQLPAPVQLAVIKSSFEFGDWLASPEGMAWRSEHAEAIGVFKWITPLANLQWTMNALSGKNDSIGDWGMLGGLPFGFITQMLDSQTDWFNLDTPYVSPKSGDVFPDWIPESSKAKAQVALVDLLSTTFSYPGRTLGLQGKAQTLRGVAGALGVDPDSDEFKRKYRLEDLSEEDKLFIQTIKQMQLPKVTPGPSLYLPPLAEIEPKEKLSTKRQKTGGGGKKTARPFDTSALEL